MKNIVCFPKSPFLIPQHWRLEVGHVPPDFALGGPDIGSGVSPDSRFVTCTRGLGGGGKGHLHQRSLLLHPSPLLHPLTPPPAHLPGTATF